MAPTRNTVNALAAEVTLTETYHDMPFLAKLASQRPESPVMTEHQITAQKLLKRLRGNNAVKVAYRQHAYSSVPMGRLYPRQKQFTCFQNMFGSLRRVLAGGQYVEIDMVNAHFKLLAGAFPHATAVRNYCDDRDSYLRAVSEAARVPPSVAKALFIILIFGGSVGTWRTEFNVADDAPMPACVEELKRDVDFCKAVKEADADYSVFVRAARAKNQQQGKPWENTAFAFWLQDLEARCMLEAVKFIRSGGVEVASLIHDGALIAADDRDRVDLGALGDHVRHATGLECAFAVKPLDLKEKDLEWKKTVEEGTTQAVELTDSAACITFLQWMAEEGCRIVKCEGKIYVYDPSEGVYRDRTRLDGFRIMIYRCGEARLGSHAECSAKQSKLLVQLPDFVAEDPRFILDAELSGKRRIAWNNGIFDFTTKQLIPFSPDIVLFYKLPHDYPVDEASKNDVEEIVAEIRARVVEAIWGGSAEFVLQSTARCYAGEIQDKLYFLIIGDGNSGKGVWMDANWHAFPGYVGSIASGNLLYTGGQGGDQAKANSWMVAIRNCRINFTSEIKVGRNVIIDNNTLKELSSGGETLSGRQNHADEMRFVMQGMCWSFANDLPRIQNIKSDDATQNRLVFIPMPYRYLVDEKYEQFKHLPHVREGDPSIKDWLKRPEVSAAFAYMICHAYVPDRPLKPPVVDEYTKEWSRGDDEVEIGLGDWLVAGDATSFVSSKKLMEEAEFRGFIVSSTKLGKMVKDEFGLKSEPKRIPGKGTVRGYVGLQIIDQRASTD